MARSAVVSCASDKRPLLGGLCTVIGGVADGVRAFLQYQRAAGGARPEAAVELARRAIAGR